MKPLSKNGPSRYDASEMQPVLRCSFFWKVSRFFMFLRMFSCCMQFRGLTVALFSCRNADSRQEYSLHPNLRPVSEFIGMKVERARLGREYALPAPAPVSLGPYFVKPGQNQDTLTHCRATLPRGKTWQQCCAPRWHQECFWRFSETFLCPGHKICVRH